MASIFGTAPGSSGASYYGSPSKGSGGGSLAEIVQIHECLKRELASLRDLLASIASSTAGEIKKEKELGLLISPSAASSVKGNFASCGDADSMQVEGPTNSTATSPVLSRDGWAHAPNECDCQKEAGSEENTKQAIIQKVLAQFDFIFVIYHSHSRAEDDVILPAAKARGLNLQAFEDFGHQHASHTHCFEELKMELSILRKSGSWTDQSTIDRASELSEELHRSLLLHMRLEEEELLPLLQNNFSSQEIHHLVGDIMGMRSSELISQYLDMVKRDLPEQDQEIVLNSLCESAKGTRFERWLSHTHQKPSEIDETVLTPAVQNIQLSPNEGAFPTFWNKDSTVMGCSHFRRRCKIFTPCCGALFTCHNCHDEQIEKLAIQGRVHWHKLNREDVRHCWCMICGTLQRIGSSCTNCHISFGSYFCEACRIMDDQPVLCESDGCGVNSSNTSKSSDQVASSTPIQPTEAGIYHCPFCDLCRRGKGLGKDFFHCMKCNACVSSSLRVHKCVSHALEGNCPICCENLFTSRKITKSLPCGHVLHKSCFDEHLKNGDYRCAQCRASMVDMSSYWRALDQKLPKALSKDERRIQLSCHDCRFTGEAISSPTRQHLLRLSGIAVNERCSQCGSYNTF